MRHCESMAVCPTGFSPRRRELRWWAGLDYPHKFPDRHPRMRGQCVDSRVRGNDSNRQWERAFKAKQTHCPKQLIISKIGENRRVKPKADNTFAIRYIAPILPTIFEKFGSERMSQGFTQTGGGPVGYPSHSGTVTPRGSGVQCVVAASRDQRDRQWK